MNPATRTARRKKSPQNPITKAAELRYEKFCQAYVKEPHATKAAIVAGYSKKSAHVIGCKLLKVPKVQQRMLELQEQWAAKYDLDRDKVWRKLSLIINADLSDFTRVNGDGEVSLDLSKAPKELWAAIHKYREDTTGGTGDGERKLIIRTTVELESKLKALELAMEHLGMIRTKMDVNLKTDVYEHIVIELQEARKALPAAQT